MGTQQREEALSVADTINVPPTASSPSLLLRAWTEQDIPAMLAAHRDPVMRRWLQHPIATAEEARRVILDRQADRLTGSGFSFAVFTADSEGSGGNLVGGVNIRGLSDDAASGEVGYWVASPARGRGIAPRALDAACEWAFRLPRRRPLDRLNLIHAVDNQASCRVADKTAFTLSTVLPPLPPEFPNYGHLHIRLASDQ
jgi:RimJ/RimL family protein N-acetyltransferase